MAGLTRSAAVALVIRRPTELPDETSAPLPPKEEGGLSSSNGPSAAAVMSWSRAEVLFIRRAVVRGDPWSGQVAFPGGKVEPTDANEESAAMREAFEEIHLDLASAPFQALGLVTRREVASGSNSKFGVACYAWQYVGPLDQFPALRPHEGEVASVRWIPLSWLAQPPRAVPVWYSVDPKSGFAPSRLLQWLGLSAVAYPGIPLPSEPDLYAAWAGSQRPNGSQATAQCEGYVLWGLTLRFVDDFLAHLDTCRLMDRAPLKAARISMLHTNSPLLNMLLLLRISPLARTWRTDSLQVMTSSTLPANLAQSSKL